MVKLSIKSKNKSRRKSKNKETKTLKNLKKVIKTIDTVIPISTPVGSVHFDEFLKICKEPKLIKNITETAKKIKEKKNNKTKETEKSKKVGISKKKVDIKPDDIPPSPQPTLFPLIKALLLPSDNDALDENILFSVSYTILMKSYEIKMLRYRNLLLVNLKQSI